MSDKITTKKNGYTMKYNRFTISLLRLDLNQ